MIALRRKHPMQKRWKQKNTKFLFKEATMEQKMSMRDDDEENLSLTTMLVENSYRCKTQNTFL
jgi:hypothetical protein